MPFIKTTANVQISARKAAAIKARMGEAIELIPGKSENWLMLQFVDDATMFFKGEDEPCAVCEVKLFGSADEESYTALTGALTDVLREELDIDPDRIYVTFEEIGVWGWNGGLL